MTHLNILSQLGDICMSSKHFSRKGANVKLVQNRKPLARAKRGNEVTEK